jgi:hypothetical protein
MKNTTTTTAGRYPNTILMLAIFAAFLITWLVIATFIFFLSDNSFRASMIHPLTGLLMLIIGWLPAYVVSQDLTGDNQ